MRLFPRRRANAHELIALAVTRRDYRAAAVLITAGALAVLEQASETQEHPSPERTLALALAKVTASQ